MTYIQACDVNIHAYIHSVFNKCSTVIKVKVRIY